MTNKEQIFSNTMNSMYRVESQPMSGLTSTGTNRAMTFSDRYTPSGVKNLMEVFNEEDDQVPFNVPTDYNHDVPINNSNVIDLWEGYLSLGAPSVVCASCSALMWNNERNNKSTEPLRSLLSNGEKSIFSIHYTIIYVNYIKTCNGIMWNGSVRLPSEEMAPEPLRSLLSNGE
ncbi:uncharacterized protein LOC135150224 isoform X1 [Daucus carota subsp. sativus]|uniref:uncharacterized protein LOC135150224 isoform X1 n=1 Tax=Daucus carota subsp. sativus TaxID=79200 RepID=UPI003082DC72